jgi:TrmH family RNA methyltransferase
MDAIRSRANQQLKLARRVRAGREPGLIFVEGERLVRECLDTDLKPYALLYLSSASQRFGRLLSRARERGGTALETEEKVFAALGDTVSSQGIILIAERPSWTLDQLLDHTSHHLPLVVVLDGVQDPGNLGTLVRTAEAAGAGGVIALPGCADPFAPKTLRAAMGSAFRLPVISGIFLDSVIAECRGKITNLIGTGASATLEYTEVDWRVPTMVFFGSEASGLSPEVLARCKLMVRIPLQRPVESLNVASAAAIILFEAARQRR